MNVLPYQPTSFSLGKTLSQAQAQHFDKFGFLHFKHFLTPIQVTDILAELSRVQQEWLDQGINKINGTPLKFGQEADGSPLIQRMCFLNNYSELLSELMQSEAIQSLTKLLAPYEGRVAHDEKDGLVLNHYIRQPNSKFSQMGWHTDSPRDLFLGQKILPMLNIGLHLDGCLHKNGGLRVLPGTHKANIFQTVLGKKQFIDHKADPREAGFDIESGDLTVHHGSLWHRVEASPFTGEASRRRVLYFPIVTGAYSPKDENTKTPFYHRLGKFVHS
jgi:phytanoyl-CoA hydroxylase